MATQGLDSEHVGMQLQETAVTPDAPHDEGGEPIVGTQVRFASDTLKRRKGRASRPLFGTQLRFAIRTIRNAIDRRRSGPERVHA